MYEYAKERETIFTEQGHRLFLEIRDKIQDLLAKSGSVKMGNAIAGCTGDSWQMMACVDRLVELGEICEVTQPNTPGQHRVFVSSRDHS